jgi:hypothetical protein
MVSELRTGHATSSSGSGMEDLPKGEVAVASSASDNSSITSKFDAKHCPISHVYVNPLENARAVTLSPKHYPSVRTKLSCVAGRMATQRGLEYNQISPNACVLLLLAACDCSDSDLLLQPEPTEPRSLAIAKRTTRVRQSFLLCGDIGREPSWNSTESHGRLSIGLSEQRVQVQVTGSFLTIP